MDVNKLGTYFIRFNQLARGDGFIDKDGESKDYNETLAMIPDKKIKGAAAKDRKIDFNEYLEATGGFSKTEIQANRTLILDYPAEHIDDLRPLKNDQLERLYLTASATGKKSLISRLELLLTDKDPDIGFRAAKFIQSVYLKSPAELKGYIRSGMESLFFKDSVISRIKKSLGYENNKLSYAAIYLFALIYKDFSEYLKVRIREKIGPFLKDNDWRFRMHAGDFFGWIYVGASEGLKKEILAKIEPSLKDKDWRVRLNIIYAYEHIYFHATDQVQLYVSSKMDTMTKDENEAIRTAAIRFFIDASTHDSIKYSF